MSRYQSGAPTRSVWGQIRRSLGWFLLVVVVIGAGIAGGAYLYDQHTLQEIEATGGTKIATKKLHPIKSVNDPAIALVAGYDVRAGTGASSYAGSNSDTLMLLRADPKTDTLSLLSFPRDLNVPIYCKGNTVSTYDRINAAWADCGSDNGPLASVNTMEHLTGLPINYLITLDFNAFKQIVNRLHGVYLNVDRRYYNPPDTGYSAINLQPGYQKLNGGQALAYVRFRHLDSDIYRNGRQQLFLEALKQRVKSELSFSNFLLLPHLIGALHGNLQVGKAGGGALTNAEVLSYLDLIKNLPPGHLIPERDPASGSLELLRQRRRRAEGDAGGGPRRRSVVPPPGRSDRAPRAQRAEDAEAAAQDHLGARPQCRGHHRRGIEHVVRAPEARLRH